MVRYSIRINWKSSIGFYSFLHTQVRVKKPHPITKSINRQGKINGQIRDYVDEE